MQPTRGHRDPEKQLAVKRAEELFEHRKKIMKLSPDEALDEILASRQPAALVHAFPDEDFHFLVREIGPEDSVPLLALASQKQWEYIVDMEVWRRDRLILGEMGRWLDLLLEADSKRMIRWMLNEQTELLELYLSQNLDIAIREHDQDPSDFGDDFFTLDGVFYIRVAGADSEDDSEAGQLENETRRRFLTTFLDRLAKYDFLDFQKTILETIHLIPAETEEEAFRLRSVRMAERGFPPFDEAVGIYQPMSAREIEQKRELFSRGIGDPAEMSLYRIRAPITPIELANGADEFLFSLKKISMEEILPVVESEFASLCNRIISADQKIVRSRDQLRGSVKKALGYLSIGMDYLAGPGEKINAGQMAAIVESHPLEWIFRAGYGRALALKWRAEKWRRESWQGSRDLALTFWDEKWMGVLGGLLIKKPLFFDNYETGVIYREFGSSGDIEKTAEILDKIIAVDRLLSLMEVDDFFLAPGRLLTYKNLLLTMWIKDCLHILDGRAAISMEKFRPFFDRIFEGKIDPLDREPPAVRPDMKDSFLNWVMRRAGLERTEITDVLAEVFEELFQEVRAEVGFVAAKHLDPRYVNLFLLE